MVTTNKWIVLGSILCLLSVVLGAFGAHGLKAMLSPESLSSFEVGVRYQMYHGLAIILLAIIGRILTITTHKSCQFLAIGVLLFSVSIYFLACKALLPFSVTWLGPVTPIGGLLMIIGWVIFIISVLKTDKYT